MPSLPEGVEQAVVGLNRDLVGTACWIRKSGHIGAWELWPRQTCTISRALCRVVGDSLLFPHHPAVLDA